TRERLGRPTLRIALLPRLLGRCPWVLEVDAETNYPLMRAEFDLAGNLVSMLEVTDFEIVPPDTLAGVSWWQPKQRITALDHLDSALTALGADQEDGPGLTIP